MRPRCRFATNLFYVPAKPARRQRRRLQQNAARSAPLKAHSPRPKAHSSSINVAPSRTPQTTSSRLTSDRLMSICSNVTGRCPRPFPISHFLFPISLTSRKSARIVARNDTKMSRAAQGAEGADYYIMPRSAPLKAHTARRTAHSYSSNVAPA